MSDQLPGDLFIASFTFAELLRGIRQLPPSHRRSELEAWFAGPDGPDALFAGRILPFDRSAAQIWADLIADGLRAGTPRSAQDMIIAATALASGCVMVTRNTKHFRDVVEVLDPCV